MPPGFNRLVKIVYTSYKKIVIENRFISVVNTLIQPKKFAKFTNSSEVKSY